jgi:hypothetical protein
MLIPKHWSSATDSAEDPEGKSFALKIWGWSENSVAEAAQVARRRLSEATSRVRQGTLGKDQYYGKTPLREEIVRVLEGSAADPSGAAAVVTRNRYGALVLNAARVPFIDVDTPPSSGGNGGGLLGSLFGGKKEKPDGSSALLDGIRAACARFSSTSFRIYRTAAGFRLLATDLLLDPKSSETEKMLSEFRADPYFVKLCKLQASFRARLTPKPWRAGLAAPPAAYPFDSPAAEREFADWLRRYEAACAGKATCAFVEAVGPGRTLDEARPIVAEHDRACRVGESLPLA